MILIFSTSQILYNKEVSFFFFKLKDFTETYFYLSPSWGILGNVVGKGSLWGGVPKPLGHTQCQKMKARAPQCSKLPVPQGPVHWVRAASWLSQAPAEC